MKEGRPNRDKLFAYTPMADMPWDIHVHVTIVRLPTLPLVLEAGVCFLSTLTPSHLMSSLP